MQGRKSLTTMYGVDKLIQLKIVTTIDLSNGREYACIESKYDSQLNKYIYCRNITINEKALHSHYIAGPGLIVGFKPYPTATTLQGTPNTTIQNNVHISKQYKIGDILYSNSGQVQLILIKKLITTGGSTSWETLLHTLHKDGSYKYASHSTVQEKILSKYYRHHLKTTSTNTIDVTPHIDERKEKKVGIVNPIHYNDVPTTDEELTRAMEITRLLCKG